MVPVPVVPVPALELSPGLFFIHFNAKNPPTPNDQQQQDKNAPRRRKPATCRQIFGAGNLTFTRGCTGAWLRCFAESSRLDARSGQLNDVAPDRNLLGGGKENLRAAAPPDRDCGPFGCGRLGGGVVGTASTVTIVAAFTSDFVFSPPALPA